MSLQMFFSRTQTSAVPTSHSDQVPTPPYHSRERQLIIGCDLYEFMASRTLEKTVKFFEGGQAAILEETVVEEEPEPEDSLDALWNWEELRGKIDCGDTERFVEVGIGTGADDSEWFRIK